MLNPDGSVPTGGRVRIVPGTITEIEENNLLVDTNSIVAEVGELGIWTASLIVGVAYTFNFEKVINGVRTKFGSIVKTVTESGPVLFGDL